MVDSSKPTAVRLDFAGTKEVAKGTRFQLKPELSPAGAASAVTFKSSNSKAVKILNAKTGEAEAVGVGTATITVTTDVGKKTAKATVKVYDPLTVSEVSMAGLKTANIILGGRHGYGIRITPESAIVKSMTVTSSNTKVATAYISNGFVLITGVKKGTSTITLKTDNGKKAMLKVTVK